MKREAGKEARQGGQVRKEAGKGDTRGKVKERGVREERGKEEDVKVTNEER